MGNGIPWRSVDDKWMRRLYPDRPTAEVARLLGRSVCSVNGRATTLGLRKTKEYMASDVPYVLRRDARAGIAHRYPKGHVPANKGLRRPGYAPGRMAQTQFKKGQVSVNTMPMWSFRWCDGYLMLKTGAPTPKSTTGWEYVHKLIWEQANGPLPDWREARIWWKDGDHGNCALSNLELVRGKDHVARTTVHRLPAELKEVIQLTGVLKRRIGSLANEEHAV